MTQRIFFEDELTSFLLHCLSETSSKQFLPFSIREIANGAVALRDNSSGEISVFFDTLRWYRIDQEIFFAEDFTILGIVSWERLSQKPRTYFEAQDHFLKTFKPIGKWGKRMNTLCFMANLEKMAKILSYLVDPDPPVVALLPTEVMAN